MTKLERNPVASGDCRGSVDEELAEVIRLAHFDAFPAACDAYHNEEKRPQQLSKGCRAYMAVVLQKLRPYLTPKPVEETNPQLSMHSEGENTQTKAPYSVNGELWEHCKYCDTHHHKTYLHCKKGTPAPAVEAQEVDADIAKKMLEQLVRIEKNHLYPNHVTGGNCRFCDCYDGMHKDNCEIISIRETINNSRRTHAPAVADNPASTIPTKLQEVREALIRCISELGEWQAAFHTEETTEQAISKADSAITLLDQCIESLSISGKDKPHG